MSQTVSARLLTAAIESTSIEATGARSLGLNAALPAPLSWSLSAGSYVVSAKADDPIARPARARLIWAANTAQAMQNLGVRTLLVGTNGGLPFKTDTLAGVAAARRYLSHLYGVKADFDLRVIPSTGNGHAGKSFAATEFPRHVFPEAGLVHTRDPAVALECAKLRINYIWEHHDEGYQNEFTAMQDLRLDRPQCRAIVAITESVRDRLLGLGVPPAKSIVLPSGVNATTHQLRQERASSWRRFLLAGGYTRLVAYSGGMQHERGIEHLLLAAEKLPHVRFVFLGGHEADLGIWRTELSRRRISNCKLLGYHPHETVCEVQQASDVLVFTRLASGRPDVTSPLKFFEYLLSGVPIVAASVPSLQQLPKDLDVRFYDPGEALALTAVLQDRLGQDNWPQRSDVNVAAGLKYTWEMRQRALLDFIGPIEARTTF